jgi:hypothetical protein
MQFPSVCDVAPGQRRSGCFAQTSRNHHERARGSTSKLIDKDICFALIIVCFILQSIRAWYWERAANRKPKWELRPIKYPGDDQERYLLIVNDDLKGVELEHIRKAWQRAQVLSND